jgi:polar amino acid transport system permease protein
MSSDLVTVWQHRDLLLSGLLTTVSLSVVSAAAALVLGAALATALMARRRFVAATARVLVDTMRCVPFLLFAYLIYYGLPSLGVRLDNWNAGMLALVLYNTAYMGELLRAAWQELPPETIEAGHAFGFHGVALVRRIILPPVLVAATPMIGNQVIQIIKDSAFLTIIAVQELTHAANALQNTYFIPFAAFLSAVVLYWGLCLAVEGGVALVGRQAEARR